ncbi:LON peptidase substrate-binding domain-containing protein [Pelagibacteraceae bacterium]|nr:LON peptidase substrate-binding domain-containing protein [Pelagibacteraceae bacterium]
MKFIYPAKIPVFPLSGVIYFPKTNLPLNIFEQRYLNLVDDVLKTNKLMGMIQPKNNHGVYKVGCLGKISDYKKSEDGRILVNLTGLIRFEIKNEVDNKELYREFNVEYEKFSQDLIESKDLNFNDFDLPALFKKIKSFFKKNGLLLNWSEFEKLELEQQINTLAMVAPISNEEKQKLLETITIEEKSRVLSEIIEFYIHEKNIDNITIQ